MRVRKQITFLFFIYPLIIAASFSLYAETISLNSATEGGDSLFSGELLTSICAKTGVVMYHGRGSAPRGPVVEEMRTSLHRAGYTTLSIENPKPLNGQTDFTSYVNDVSSENYVFPETYARMRTAINYLQSLGVEQVVIAGFSLGSRLSTAHTARGQIDEIPIIGLIGVGMYGTNIDPLNISSTLDEVNTPVFDLYGDVDADAVITASARVNAYSSGAGTDYTQSILTCITGLNCHQLRGLTGSDSAEFEVHINAWMQAFAPASLITDCIPVEPPVTTPSTPSSGGGVLSLSFLTLLVSLLFLLRKSNWCVFKYHSWKD